MSNPVRNSAQSMLLNSLLKKVASRGVFQRVVMVGLVFFVLAFAATDGRAKVRSKTLLEVEQLAVMPFIKGTTAAQQRGDRLEKNLDCQLRGLCVLETATFPEAEVPVHALVQAELRQRFGDKIAAAVRVREAYQGLGKELTDTPRDIALRLGRRLGVDHVLVGLVWRYRERVGTPMAASEPASVAFTLLIINVKSGELVWTDSFDKTQTSLSENLFDAPMFLKKGMKWLTAEELSGYGLEKMFSRITIH